MCGRFGPCVLAGNAEHRCHGVVAECDEGALMFPARARDVHVAMNDNVLGFLGRQAHTSESSDEESAPMRMAQERFS